MLKMIADGAEFPLTPLSEILQKIELDRSVLLPFQTEQSTALALWNDAGFCDQLVQRLTGSIPAGMPVDQLPTLPDQLAILLRTELTIASENEPISLEEKDRLEAQLQNMLRPVIYAHIEQSLTGQSGGDPVETVQDILSKSITIGWQSIQVNDWSVSELESIIGGVGYRFESGQKTYYGEKKHTAESAFLIRMSEAVLAKIRQD